MAEWTACGGAWGWGMAAFERVLSFILLAGVMFAGGLFAVQYFGDGVQLPPELKNAGYFLGGAGAIYWAWSIFTDALSAWREAGGIGFTLKFLRNLVVTFVRSIIAPILAAVAAVSSSWNVLQNVGETYGPTIQALATGGIMLGAASLAIITKLPEAKPKQA